LFLLGEDIMSLTEVLQGWEPLSYDYPSHLAKEHFNKHKEDIMSLTRQEVFQALADGKTIELKNPSWADYRPLDHTNYLPLKSDSFNNFDWRIKPKPLEWYENIPSQGVLCWVSDKNPKIKFGLACITKVAVGNYQEYVDRNDISWSYATPLTNEEIEQFLRGE
jgi:hypothetical protein